MLGRLPHPHTWQDKWVILTHSMQLRLQHPSRTVPPATARSQLEQHAADLRRTALQIFGHPDLHAAGLNPEATCLQLHLPLRDGGSGITAFPPTRALLPSFPLQHVQQLPAPWPPPTCTPLQPPTTPHLTPGDTCTTASRTNLPQMAFPHLQPGSSPYCPHTSAAPSTPTDMRS
jgi:hypothetical protein